jgi:hypothetical protein
MNRYYSSFWITAVMLVSWVGCVDLDDETYIESTDELSAPATAGGFPVPGKLIFNEILVNAPGTGVTGQFIEIANVGGLAVALTGWTLSTNAGVRHTFGDWAGIGAGKAYVVVGDASAIPPGIPSYLVAAASTGSLGFSEGGDTITLRTTFGNLIETVTYPAGLAAVDGVSMNRNPDANAAGVFGLHTDISSTSSSPGRRVNGVLF